MKGRRPGRPAARLSRIGVALAIVVVSSVLAGCDEQVGAEVVSAGWQCAWDPTINDDWHDDYLCSDGVGYDRPYLLPDDPFVEPSEIEAAAQAYEVSLNQ